MHFHDATRAPKRDGGHELRAETVRPRCVLPVVEAALVVRDRATVASGHRIERDVGPR